MAHSYWSQVSARSTAILFALVFLLTPALIAQSDEGDKHSRIQYEVFAGTEIEEYLRYLQTVGLTRGYPWTVRAFSPSETEQLRPAPTGHPWAGRYDFSPDTSQGLRTYVLRPNARVSFNSAFPYGSNDGPVWAGRGLTTAVRAGFAARFGPLSFVVAPIAFRAENASFRIISNDLNRERQYADWVRPSGIDFPQKFGAGSVTAIDPGQSTLRIDWRGAGAGISTANEIWGPATEHPIVLGANAPGFLHAFVGTSRPANIYIGRVHGRLVWGRLEQSRYATTSADSTIRLMSGLVGAFTPQGLPNLEIGAARFFHSHWPSDGISVSDLARPLGTLLKSNSRDPFDRDPRVGADNQIASVFARWTAARSGFEMYGEFGREDANWNARDLILEPDHQSAYTLGLRKAWVRSDTTLIAVRAELLNSHIGNIGIVRPQAPFYVHTVLRQGHTHRGQLLGSSLGYGGGGSVVAIDHYHSAGRRSISWTREIPRPSLPGALHVQNVLHTVGADVLLFHHDWEFEVGLRGIYNQNRTYGSGPVNLNATVGLRVRT